MDIIRRKLNPRVLSDYLKRNYAPDNFPKAEADYSVLEDVCYSKTSDDYASGAPFPGFPAPPADTYEGKGLCKYELYVDFKAHKNASVFGSSKPSHSLPHLSLEHKLDGGLIEAIELDVPFGTMLDRWVAEKGMTPSQFYKRANITKSTYSSIICNPEHIPKKETVVACAIGLMLDIDDSEKLLERAGYKFSTASLGDMIVKCYIENGVFDIDEINEVLFENDQTLLGAKNK